LEPALAADGVSNAPDMASAAMAAVVATFADLRFMKLG
jgi:hypothetical protein